MSFESLLTHWPFIQSSYYLLRKLPNCSLKSNSALKVGQEGVTGTRFTFLPETIKKKKLDKIYETGFQKLNIRQYIVVILEW